MASCFGFSFSVVTGVDCGDELQDAQFLGSRAQLSSRVLRGGSEGEDEGATWWGTAHDGTRGEGGRRCIRMVKP